MTSVYFPKKKPLRDILHLNRRLLAILLFTCLTLGCQGAGATKIAPVEGAEDPVNAQWEFSRATQVSYRLLGKETATSSTNSYETSPDEVAGYFDLELTSAKGKSGDLTAKESGDTLLAGINSSGVAAEGMDDIDGIFLQMLFLLPQQEMKVGETIDESHRLKVRSLLTGAGSVEGKRGLSFEGYYQVDGDLCAKFHSEFRYTKFLNQRGEVLNSVPVDLSATSEVYYSVKRKEVVLAEVDGQVKTTMKGMMGDVGSDKSVELTLSRR